MRNSPCVILARGGSKGIPNKNIIDFLGKPLVAWTIECALRAHSVSSVWVSSDDDRILDIASGYDVENIPRPTDISNDLASSEAAWLHALDYIEAQGEVIDLFIAPQCTSPIREPFDFDEGIRVFIEQGYDSLFSAFEAPDMNIWQIGKDGLLNSINYNYRNRKRRQDTESQYLENGSFYIFKPSILRQHENRLGGNIGVYCMELWKSFQIDRIEDIRFCETLMNNYLLEK